MDATDPVASGRTSREVEALVESNVRLARWAVTSTTRWPGESYDEMLADALVGLFDAARRWDADKASFPCFAVPRIRGAIADGRRERDPLTRGARRRGEPMPLALDYAIPRQREGENLTLADTLEDPNDDMTALLDLLEQQERSAWLADSLSSLRPQQRQVMEGLLAGRKLQEIGDELGLTESRISQIKKAALERLACAAAA
ncbi:MAG TPA: sigma-70 family RNA polymerase sigma factor [Mycobacteriales bacterium]|nr:sigma-70 family RNA polymerase sigma factor [Mycobacteriales bacterium]